MQDLFTRIFHLQQKIVLICATQRARLDIESEFMMNFFWQRNIFMESQFTHTVQWTRLVNDPDTTQKSVIPLRFFVAVNFYFGTT